jgi:hypothetical protein
LASELAAAERKIEQDKRDDAVLHNPDAMVQSVSLQASDPAAKEFLRRKKPRVQALLRVLAEHEQL